MQDFRNLDVWRLAHANRLDVYRLTRNFPPEERFGLTSQIRRSASSIATNIAEACGYRGKADSGRYYQIAVGSCTETLDHLILSRDLGYLPEEVYRTLEDQTQHILAMLLNILKRIRGE